MSVTFKLNGKKHTLTVDPDTPLLWVIREHLHLTGTKFGCGMALCGACTVHVDGEPVRSCSTAISAVSNKSITTIEGLDSKAGRAIQDAWETLAVVQCGYCQSGQILSATALLENNPTPSDQDIDQFMAGNICRCATYHRIRKAIKHAATQLAQKPETTPSKALYTEVRQPATTPLEG